MLKLSQYGVEINGQVRRVYVHVQALIQNDLRIVPTPPEDRVDTRLYQMFFVWFTVNANILQFSAGSVGPVVYGLGMRESLLTILVTDILSSAIPAYLAVFGPKLGTRAMVLSRFSWGYYGAAIPSILNVISMEGYLILNCILGGQTLASVSDHLSPTLGIVIIALVSFAITFCGYKVVHLYEMVCWIPNIITFIVMLAVGGKNLINTPLSTGDAASASSILSFGAVVAASVISWSTVTPDYGVYHDSKDLALLIHAREAKRLDGQLIGHLMGAAFAAGAPSVPSWSEGLSNGSSIGGLIGATLSPCGNFGKFLTVLLALTVPSPSSVTMYTTCTSFMTISRLFAKIPRILLAMASTAVLIPVAIVGANSFYATAVDVLNMIGYWMAPYSAIILAEHWFYRKITFGAYNVKNWDNPRRLPLGAAAIFVFLASFGIIVPCMSQVWYTGPIAKAGTGDIGMVTSFIFAMLVYPALRTLEGVITTRWRGVDS
ncbi:hypothetical protein SERLADRAFT_360944 [Serpula lacrymans var. lacrymans S7.9]|uniref:Cytosine-purine permease n=1 Tax=Serpula lacrymans var. lacrymans (strain S7.9) TaxID=578457 RepID=F8NSH0_SERL9|nr:uncharacterized protein SERLADRAFT_360944 [Serpula lacrymans var. lacrymans S7.9]EGO26948.1 hypothetical protein SERLADRAFT_360944 [Serpula lacrymans var. lacrymans S7.9]